MRPVPVPRFAVPRQPCLGNRADEATACRKMEVLWSSMMLYGLELIGG